MSDPIVEVAQGKLKGKVLKTAKNVEYYTFKGIPYAKPPVGELRFSVPVPPESWVEIKDATKDCNASPQYDVASGFYIGSEDCLVLNVTTPKLPSAGLAKLPVMFYVHGGGFVFGHGTDDSTNGPEYLVEKGVVVVAINYRLGVLGFLTLDCKDAPGNMGLRDQVQALKWVKQNIAKFNGDPDNVTIFGLSAGAASIEYLMLTPIAKGLFHKAIAEGGSSLCHWAQNSKVKQLAYKIAALNDKKVSNDDELLKYLKSLDTKELIMSSMKVLATEEFRGGINFGYVPVIEKRGDWVPLLDQRTYNLLKKGEYTKVPFMSGFATREGLLLLALNSQRLEKVVSEKNFVQYLPFELNNIQEIEIENKLKDIYLKTKNIFDEPDAFGIDYFSDVVILGGVHTATSLIVQNNNYPVYNYEFSYDGKLNHIKKVLGIDRRGACHSDEIGYLLKVSGLPDPGPKDYVVRERMVTLWTNFAKYGNPTPKTDGLITTKWEPATPTKMQCLLITDTLQMKDEVYKNSMELYKELYEKYTPSQ
ncbi:juvenile hormone esterase-like [Pectinophora gossypiella]|uniref:juvenile hormone esterase-like n=1 Tax=Pectinophora gossypiella TaxID=13191 RepID=UPI00214F38E2|nr:juvenile hormone esterase-like [Pectinophora gossypiella]